MSVGAAETSTSIQALDSHYSCPCGWTGSSVLALHAHRGSAHEVVHPVHAYMPDNRCSCCLVEFPTRGLLYTHLTRGSGLCFLNVIMHHPPLPQTEIDDLREQESFLVVDRLNSGLRKHHADSPPIRSFGPLKPIYSTSGTVVDTDDNRHPFGPKKRKYVRSCFPACECQECLPIQ